MKVFSKNDNSVINVNDNGCHWEPSRCYIILIHGIQCW